MKRKRGLWLFWRRLRNGARAGFDVDPEGDLIYVDSEALSPSERRVVYGWPPSRLPIPRMRLRGYDRRDQARSEFADLAKALERRIGVSARRHLIAGRR